jgi:hypothetical protein
MRIESFAVNYSSTRCRLPASPLAPEEMIDSIREACLAVGWVQESIVYPWHDMWGAWGPFYRPLDPGEIPDPAHNIKAWDGYIFSVTTPVPWRDGCGTEAYYAFFDPLREVGGPTPPCCYWVQEGATWHASLSRLLEAINEESACSCDFTAPPSGTDPTDWNVFRLTHKPTPFEEYAGKIGQMNDCRVDGAYYYFGVSSSFLHDGGYILTSPLGGVLRSVSVFPSAQLDDIGVQDEGHVAYITILDASSGIKHTLNNWDVAAYQIVAAPHQLTICRPSSWDTTLDASSIIISIPKLMPVGDFGVIYNLSPILVIEGQRVNPAGMWGGSLGFTIHTMRPGETIFTPSTLEHYLFIYQSGGEPLATCDGQGLIQNAWMVGPNETGEIGIIGKLWDCILFSGKPDFPADMSFDGREWLMWSRCEGDYPEASAGSLWLAVNDLF